MIVGATIGIMIIYEHRLDIVLLITNKVAKY
ncbi:hypothetical protein Vdis_1219 [Vulcanisaeta distributa DSM 14429]|uniref:Uncharacterized protein n=1 Tax=Vulcanisaeta distributa (strain DSM 14429 / JCM 11212 / NBRC 100878 / IC-017) TaxID=572478 RepID=E1QRA8_VULDI|nr:hypothetical protein Vdis_1219 [Vulcanisaeta distributa DSM 14429]